MTPEIFGAFITEQRKANNLTQKELADILHVSTNAISKWERGKCLPEVTKLEDIANALNLTLIEVMQCRTLENTSQETNEILTDTINLATSQHKRKYKRTVGFILATIIVGICIYVFPVYHIAQVWSPDFFTTGEVSKLAFRGTPTDLEIARLYVSKANEAMESLELSSSERKAQYGLLSRYGVDKEYHAVSENHSMKIWAADFDNFDGYGYVWVYYSFEAYGENGDTVCGSSKVPALWVFEKNENNDKWELLSIKEHP